MLDLERIWRSPQLPSLPAAAVRLLELSKDADAPLKWIVEVVRTDPALAVRVLQAANSAQIAARGEVTTLERAVALMGKTLITSIAMSFSLVDQSMAGGELGSHFADFWRHSAVAATAAEVLCEITGSGDRAEAFQAALIMDIGRLAMLRTIPEEYSVVLRRAENEQRELPEIERELLGASHVEIGLAMSEKWSLPKRLQHAIAWHHGCASEWDQSGAKDATAMLRLVATAQWVARYFCGKQKAYAINRLRAAAEANFGLRDEALEAFLERANARAEQTAELLKVPMDRLPSCAELLAEANAQLAQIAIQAHLRTQIALQEQQVVEQENASLKQANKVLQDQAVIDPLTGVYNRRFLDERLAVEVRRGLQSLSPLGVLFVDLDYFKRLNDTHGHALGDKVLAGVAQALQLAVRGVDVVARYGGEEFVVLISQPYEHELATIAERLRRRVEMLRFGEQEQSISVTASIGGAIGIPDGRADFGLRLTAAADEALYEAKKNGRNQVCMRSMLDDLERRLQSAVSQRLFRTWLSRKHLALPRGEEAIELGDGPRKDLEALAVEMEFLGPAEIARLKSVQQGEDLSFTAAALREEILSEEQMAVLLALHREPPIELAASLVRRSQLELEQAERLSHDFIAECRSTRGVAALAG